MATPQKGLLRNTRREEVAPRPTTSARRSASWRASTIPTSIPGISRPRRSSSLFPKLTTFSAIPRSAKSTIRSASTPTTSIPRPRRPMPARAAVREAEADFRAASRAGWQDGGQGVPFDFGGFDFSDLVDNASRGPQDRRREWWQRLPRHFRLDLRRRPRGGSGRGEAPSQAPISNTR